MGPDWPFHGFLWLLAWYPMPDKVCSKCKITKSFEEFHNASKSKDGKMYKCIPCANEDSKAWIRANPDKNRASQRKRRTARLNKQRLTRYGVSEEDYEKRLSDQNGVCAICEEPETSRQNGLDIPRQLSVDHCHATGKVRGLLCFACNSGLGSFKDKPERLRRDIAYLVSTTEFCPLQLV